MSIYEEEMFNYLTKEKNFEVAFEVSEKFPQVKKDLIEQFWRRVEDKLIKLSDGLDWKVELDKDVYCLSLTPNEWIETFCPCYEKLDGKVYYGLWIYDESKLDMDKIKIHSEKIECLQGMKRNSKQWLGWIEKGEDFNSINTLKRILPENRENFADEIAQFLFDFTEEIKPDIDKINKMRIN